MESMQRACLFLTFVGLLATGGSRPVAGDLIRLTSGGELRGVVQTNWSLDPDGRIVPETGNLLTIATLSGAEVSISVREVEFILRRSAVEEELETRLRSIEETAAARFELAEWCRQQGLSANAAEMYRQVLELEDQHEGARKALGHRWRDGRWVDYDAEMQAKGYVLHKGKYITPEELDLIEKSAAELEAEREWFKSVRMWSAWIQGRVPGRQEEGWKALGAIDDPNAAPAVARFLGEDPHREIRLYGVRILSELTGAKPIPSLVRISLQDPDDEIRYLAVQGIGPENFEHAMTLYLRQLRSDQNVVVCRAALGLARVGDDRAVAPLIQSLVTTHRYRVRVPAGNSQAYSFGSDGNFGAGLGSGLPPDIEAGLRTGAYRTGNVIPEFNPSSRAPGRVVVVPVVHQNAEVREALRKLTGMDHGYDIRTWRLWWASEHPEAVATGHKVS